MMARYPRSTSRVCSQVLIAAGITPIEVHARFDRMKCAHKNAVSFYVDQAIAAKLDKKIGTGNVLLKRQDGKLSVHARAEHAATQWALGENANRKSVFMFNALVPQTVMAGACGRLISDLVATAFFTEERVDAITTNYDWTTIEFSPIFI